MTAPRVVIAILQAIDDDLSSLVFPRSLSEEEIEEIEALLEEIAVSRDDLEMAIGDISPK